MSWNGNDLFNSTLMGGMPSGADPHQYLTTDGNGKPHWEDKLAYDETRYVTVVPTTHFTTWGSAPKSVDVENIVLPKDGSTCRITLDEQVYECEATVSAEDSATLKVTSSFTITVHSDYFFIVGTPGGSEHTIYIEEIVRDFKPLDPKYLPSGSGGGFVVHATLIPDPDGGTGTATFDKTFEGTLAALKAGQYVSCQCVLPELDGITQVLPAYSYNGDMISFMIYAGAAVVMVDMMPTEGSYEFITTT